MRRPRDAEARERQAEAEAKATRMGSEAIAGGNVQAINFFIANHANHYVEALKRLASANNQKAPIIPADPDRRARLEWWFKNPPQTLRRVHWGGFRT